MNKLLKDKKEIHVLLDFIHNYPPEILPYGYYVGFSHSRAEVQRDIELQNPIIFTSQTSVCNTVNIEKGYRIFVYMLDKKTVVELKLGSIEGCDKEIRKAHNLEKMLLAGVFGQSNIDQIENRRMQQMEDLKEKCGDEDGFIVLNGKKEE